MIGPDILFEENTQSFIANLEVLPKLLAKLKLYEKILLFSPIITEKSYREKSSTGVKKFQEG